ncbi:MAG: hypothetical protein K8S00_05205 [Bacteroidales bacterium]|nr:hypothetical protein [Bacteroidales bacterium]
MAESNIKDINPFPGIRSYDINEDEFFFGRDTQTKELVTKLTNTQFLAIIGSSGCGKSSLIKAGMIPAILKGKFKDQIGEDAWSLSMFKPGEDPIGNMAVSINKTLSEEEIVDEELSSVEKIKSFLRSNKNALSLVFKKINKKSQKNRLVFIDQFEELFRFKKSKTSYRTITEASDFVDLFLDACNQSDTRVFVVLSMRSDFLDECTEYRDLTEKINKGHYLVPRMVKEEIKEAITGPAKICGAKMSDKLVERLLNEVGDDPDQLPILQHALMRTWDFWKVNRIGDQVIEVQHYEAIGTMSEALSYHAEEIYNELPSQRSRHIAEKLFKALTDYGDDSRGTRRPTQLNEICTLADAKQDEVINIINSFREPGRAFLMPSFKISINEDSMIDISHESLMRVWKRLKNWIEEEIRSAELYLRLAYSAELYQEGKSALWINPELELALKWQETNNPNLTWAMRYNPAFDRAMSFLSYSKKEFELDIAKKENQQKRELKRARRFAIILGSASVVSVLFLIISLNLRFKAEASERKALEKEKIAKSESKFAEEKRMEAIIQKKISEQQQQIAEQQKLITEEQKQYAIEQQHIAIDQKREAVHQKQNADIAKVIAIQAKDEAEEQKAEAITQKKIADEEKNRAEVSEKNAQRLRLLAIARSIAIQAYELQKTTSDDLPALLALQAYNINKNNQGNPNNPELHKVLATVTDDNVIYHGHTDEVRSVIVSHNGSLLASCSNDGSVKLWRIGNADKKPIDLKTEKSEKKGFRNVVFSHEDKYLAAGSTNGQILIWDLTKTSDMPAVLSGHTDIVNAISLNKNGKGLYSAGKDNTIRFWPSTNTMSTSKIVYEGDSEITDICLSNSSDKLACSFKNGKILIFQTSDFSTPIEVFKEKGSPITALAFNKNSNLLATGNSSGLIEIWDLASDKAVKYIGHISGITELEFSNNDKFLGSSSYDGTIRLWEYSKAEALPIIFLGHDAWVYGLSFTPDDNKIVSGSADKTIRIWTTRSSMLADIICTKVKRNLTVEEWDKYIGSDIKYEKTCPEL